MKSTFTIVSSAVLWMICTHPALAQAEQQLTVPLSQPGRPVVLDVDTLFGSISVSAYDGAEVIIEAHDGGKEEPSETGRDGLRRISNTSFGITAEEYNNTVTVSVDRMSRGVVLDISVPRMTSVRARTVNQGSLVIQGVVGEHELSNVNGRIEATDIGGSLVANTTNGELRASFTELAPDKAMSFTTLNGSVDVTFPPNLAADLQVNAGRGQVLTDFDFEIQPQASVVERSENGERYRVRLERDVRARVGGGGPLFTFKTFNGDVIVRRR
jgi:hypothetical protein